MYYSFAHKGREMEKRDVGRGRPMVGFSQRRLLRRKVGTWELAKKYCADEIYLF